VAAEADQPLPQRRLAMTSLVVRDYDEALRFYVDTLGFTLIEDARVPEQNKRWVVIAPGSGAARLLLARAVGTEQEARIGNQTGGRVFLFLHTDDVWRDFNLYSARGVVFVRPPTAAAFGTAAVFRDLYGNLWDLIQPLSPAQTLESP
jgi:catechol 2,3-dioxygenase-like lactoylglutathione lyase family enzyme